jgi:hypothetical protein
MGTTSSCLLGRYLGLVGAVVAASLLVLAPLAAAAPVSPFVAALAGVYDGPGNAIGPELFQTDASGPVLVQVGASPPAYGRFRSAFGANGFDIQVTGGLDREVDGGAMWSDGFLVTGGVGSGVLNLSTRITGSVSGQAEMFHGVFVSPAPFDLATVLAAVRSAPGFWAVQLPNSVRVHFTGVANRCGLSNASNECGHVPLQNYAGPVDLTLTASVAFTYGQPLYVLAGFGGGVGVFGGSQSFLNSADFGISAPTGSTLASISGNTYAPAIAAPVANPVAPVVEYYNAALDHYFITADEGEHRALDGGAFGGAWKRTGASFNAYLAPAPGSSVVCRFFSTAFGLKSSHFYTAIATECDGLRSNRDWQFEAFAFHIALPDAAGNCPTATGPVYRLYNNAQGGAPNHRFTTDLGLRNEFVTNRGFTAEGYGPLGVGFCSPE